jgi:hypothetical protein
VVSYDELFQVVKSGRNRDNIRKHISTIREAFRELDEEPSTASRTSPCAASAGRTESWTAAGSSVALRRVSAPLR